ncbi:MAG: hypothetical protein H0V82_02220 [Candidatus Protochlamydia sp.]|nr:hypothetical protein [Candidatus Protochlamydia sp.]
MKDRDVLTIAIFGEAERGEFHTAYLCRELTELDQYLGNPPPHSLGLDYAVQALLFKRNLIFLRVMEEGFSMQDYILGAKLLETQKLIPNLDAICVPGVGDQKILDTLQPLCQLYHSILITNQSDFYDYLTSSR